MSLPPPARFIHSVHAKPCQAEKRDEEKNHLNEMSTTLGSPPLLLEDSPERHFTANAKEFMAVSELRCVDI